MPARPRVLLTLVCVVCKKPFTDYRNTRWCDRVCRARERDLRRGSMLSREEMRQAKLDQVMATVYEYNLDFPERAVKVVAAENLAAMSA